MKKNLLKSLFLTGLTLLSIGVFTSCSDDDNNDKNETKKKTLLSHIERDDFTVDFEYDAQNRLVKMTELELDGSEPEITIISYDNQGRISQYKYSFEDSGVKKEDVYNYTYSKDTIFQTKNNSEIDTLYVNANNQLIKAPISSMTTIEYEYDADGDLVKTTDRFVSNTSNYESVNTRTYSYSTKKGGLLDANIPSWFRVSRLDYNFILSAKSCTEIVNESVIKVDGVEKSKSSDKETYSYTYDENGKPVSGIDEDATKYTLTYTER